MSNYNPQIDFDDLEKLAKKYIQGKITKVTSDILTGNQTLSVMTKSQIIEHENNLKGIYTTASTIPINELCCVMEKDKYVVFISIEKNQDLKASAIKKQYEKEGYKYLGIMTRKDYVNKNRR